MISAPHMHPRTVCVRRFPLVMARAISAFRSRERFLLCVMSGRKERRSELLACGCVAGDTGWMGGDRVDFFVSHAGRDGAWAEWVAWQLIDAGYTVELDVWDWAAGRNFVTAMSEALARADRVVALFSAAYFEPERYTAEEWSASLVHLPGVAAGRPGPV